MNNLAPTKAQQVERQQWFLVVGQIVFRTKEEDAAPNIMQLNAVVSNRDGQFPIAQLGRVQQTLQLGFHNRMKDPTLVVLDVVVLNLIPLGLFTAEEFNAPPPGTELREVSQQAGRA